MTPITMLREGIKNGNWGAVVDAYEALTGDRLPTPASGVGIDVLEAVEALNRAVGRAGRPSTEDEVDVEVAPTAPPPKSKKAGPSPRQKKWAEKPGPKKAAAAPAGPAAPFPEISVGPVPKNLPNLFVDDYGIAAGDAEVDEKLVRNLRPSERRSAPREFDLKCDDEKCGKTFRVYAHEVPRKVDADDDQAPRHYCPTCLKKRAGYGR